MKKLEGLLSAPHTGFNEDGSVKIDIIKKQVAVLLKQNIKGVYICGTTGEGIQMSVEERKAVAEEWVKQAKGKLFIIVHTGALSITDAKELTKHAEKIKADAVSLIGTSFFRPATIDDLADYCAEICAFAPKTPFYYYHSGMSGVNFPMDKFIPVAKKKIKTFVGIKYNWNDLVSYQQTVTAAGKDIDVTWGVDEAFAGAAIYGSKSAVGSTYNYMAPIYFDIENAVKKGDIKKVDELSKKVMKVIDILVEFGGVQAGKAIMSVHGIDCGTVRRPLRPLTAEQKKEVVKRYKAIMK